MKIINTLGHVTETISILKAFKSSCWCGHGPSQASHGVWSNTSTVTVTPLDSHGLLGHCYRSTPLPGGPTQSTSPTCWSIQEGLPGLNKCPQKLKGAAQSISQPRAQGLCRWLWEEQAQSLSLAVPQPQHHEMGSFTTS